MHIAFIDISKAFDRVRYDTLFIKLSNIISGVTFRLLIVWYFGQTASIFLAGIMSDSFPVSIGVRQGGVYCLHSYLIFTSMNSVFYSILAAVWGDL